MDNIIPIKPIEHVKVFFKGESMWLAKIGTHCGNLVGNLDSKPISSLHDYEYGDCIECIQLQDEDKHRWWVPLRKVIRSEIVLD